MFSHPRILVSSLSVFDASFVKSGAVAVPRREFHALSFRLSGQITVETPESRLLSSAGELTFVPQGVSYRTEILENSRIYAVHFTTVDSYPKLAPAVITPPYPVALRNLFAGLHARYRVGLEHDLTCLSMFYEILAETARALPTPDDGGGRSPKLRAVKAQIDRRFDDPELSVAALAAQTGWSEVYFRRAFRAAFGTSPLAYIRRVRLENANHLYPAELSGGMIKRVAIARAIVMNPRYLFCDEPNSGLDPQTSIVIDNLIHEITQEYGITTIINTHDMNSVMEIGEKIVYIHDGRKWWEGTKDDILHADNRELNDFVFASAMAKRAKLAAQ